MYVMYVVCMYVGLYVCMYVMYVWYGCRVNVNEIVVMYGMVWYGMLWYGSM